MEGKRLVEAGFEVGTRYDRVCKHGTIKFIELTATPNGKFKVSGKGDKPIIDISGGAVTDTFAEHISKSSPKTPVVEVAYSPRFIEISEAGCR